MKPAKVRPYTDYSGPTGTPTIIGVNYDVWNLRISVEFDNWDGMVYVDFQSPRGFRVLDESDLQEMWDDRTNTDKWLNVVKLNGWAALEDTRPGFSQLDEEDVEYLIVGKDECVSVITEEAPDVTVIELEN